MEVLIFGNNRGTMPDIAFRLMSLILAIRDRFMSPWSILDEFNIQRGHTVVDYGCGTGSYLKRASELVGPEGKVFAVDIHELAIKAVMERSDKEQLSNVTAVRAESDSVSLLDGTADLIYVMGMFHMVREPVAFLRELSRISKSKGVLYIDDGHQSRQRTKSKIISCGAWEIVEEKKRYLKCKPTGENGE